MAQRDTLQLNLNIDMTFRNHPSLVGLFYCSLFCKGWFVIRFDKIARNDFEHHVLCDGPKGEGQELEIKNRQERFFMHTFNTLFTQV
jgi:hypothetical protein